MPTQKPSKLRITAALISVLLLPVALLYTSGNWFWIQGWIFGLWLVALTYTIFLYMYFYDPELLMERYRNPWSSGEKSWDRYFMYFLILEFMLWFLIMPMDAEKYGWSPNFPFYLE
ncbi:MAG: Isoprenylcysteine carboxyl methyltransferase, partial [Petrotoga mobilis]